MPDLTDLPDARTVFGLVDGRNLPGLLLLMAPDARFTMGNQPALRGHEQIAAANDAGPLFGGPA